MPDQLALQIVDAQPKAGPALSATSDVPEVKAAPPPISEEVNTKAAEKPAAGEKTETEKVEAKTEDATHTEADKSGENEDVDPVTSDKTPAWLKGLATKERNRARVAETARKAAEAKATELSANLTKALESIESLSKVQAARLSEQAEKEDPRPVRETFDDPGKYDDALIAWSGRRATLIAKAEAEKAVTDKFTSEKAEADKKAAKDAADKTLAEFADRKAKFIEDHPDYVEIAESDDLKISTPMAAAIINDDDGPAIAYYLGQNPDEAERISKITSGPKQIAELGRIAARLAAKPAPVTKPAPIRPLKTGSETATVKTPAEMSMEEYGAMRTRQLANQARERRGLPPLN